MEKQIQNFGQVFKRFKSPILLILLFVCFISASVGFYHLSEKEITIVDNKEEMNIKTRSKTIAQVLEEQNIFLLPEDIVEPTLDTSIEEGIQIEIKRAKSITITADGKEYEMITAATTVDEIIKESGLALGKIDKVSPQRTEELGSEKEIRIVRVTEEKRTDEEVIQYAVQSNPTKELDKGEKKLVQKGENGIKKNEIKITYEDGEEAKREIIKQEVTMEPRDEIMQVGMNDTLSTSRGATRFEKAMVVNASAYCSSDPGVNNTTSVGARLKKGVVAVDPRVIPYYTKLYIPGYGFGQALDTGGAIKGNKIDLAMGSNAEAMKFGRRNIKIYILGK